jgi:potassium-transporting ATPase KdpC subunit
MKTQSIIAFKFLLVMTVLAGIIYPLLITGLAQLSFPYKANGSIIIRDGKTIGSELIGQKFDSTYYFWSRPSAIGYNPIPSGASNYGPTSDTLKKLVNARRNLFVKLNSVADTLSVPKEMLSASGSGLDPHISPEAALLQVDRIVKARHFDNSKKDLLIKHIRNMTETPQFFILGENRINVLNLNLDLNSIDENFKYK